MRQSPELFLSYTALSLYPKCAIRFLFFTKWKFVSKWNKGGTAHEFSQNLE